MGNPDTLTLEGKKYIDAAEVLIGARRMVEGFNKDGRPDFISFESTAICEFITATDYNNYGVLMSGDTGFYSGTSALTLKLKTIENVQVKVIPGISSLSYFCSRIQMSWEDVYLLSLHGRKDNLCMAVKQHKKTFALTDGDISGICEKLEAAGLGETTVFAGENLSYENERIVKAQAKDFIGSRFSSATVLMILNKEHEAVHKFGIQEEEFIRGDVPMTKSEIRAISLSKLKIKEDAVVYDIGAGTGSVTIEMAMAAKKGLVYAIEEKKEAVELIHKNKDKFALDNIEIIQGLAPEALIGLGKPDAAFIGGSKGNLRSIIERLLQVNPVITIVINAIALETLAEAITILKEFQMIETEITQAAISKTKSVGSYHMLMGQNPVFIISARGNGNGEG